MNRLSSTSIISPHAALEALSSSAFSPSPPPAGSPSPSPSRTIPQPARRAPLSPANPREPGPSSRPYAPQMFDDTDDNEDVFEFTGPYFVRARFDFSASDPSALSFKQGDMIEVIAMLESGWWDGVLDQRRGWFPSNFVEEVDDDTLAQLMLQDADPSFGARNYPSPPLPPQSRSPERRAAGGPAPPTTSSPVKRQQQPQPQQPQPPGLGPPYQSTAPSNSSANDEQEDLADQLDDVLRLDDVLAGNYAWGGIGSTGLDDLAREMMESRAGDREQQEDDEHRQEEEEEEEEEEQQAQDEFAAAARRQAQRQRVAPVLPPLQTSRTIRDWEEDGDGQVTPQSASRPLPPVVHSQNPNSWNSPQVPTSTSQQPPQQVARHQAQLSAGSSRSAGDRLPAPAGEQHSLPRAQFSQDSLVDFEADDFAQAAAAARRRAMQLQAQASPNSPSYNRGNDEMLALERREVQLRLDDFGVPPPREPGPIGASVRSREETGGTIKASTIPAGGNRISVDATDAWLPKLSQNGQIIYVNAKTGEESWTLPDSMLGEDDMYGPNDGLGSLGTFGAEDEMDYETPVSAGPSNASTAFPSRRGSEDDRFAPPVRRDNLPYPWIAKMSDDGSYWFYVNRITGEIRRDPPSSMPDPSLNNGVQRLSVSSNRPLRQSVELQRQAVDDLERRTRAQIDALYAAPQAMTLLQLQSKINDALREVFEACVQGTAAEDDLQRAVTSHSEDSMNAAVSREESAMAALVTAHQVALQGVRELLHAFGYVGPLDKFDEMPRPAWTADMTLIGCVGLLNANVHAATVSHKVPDTGLSIWAEVMRCASRLKDVVGNFGGMVLPGMTQLQRDEYAGQPSVAALSRHSTDILGGKYGFGKPEGPTVIRPLDQVIVLEMQKLKNELDLMLRDPSVPAQPIVRLTSKLLHLSTTVDIASAVDIDGDPTEPSRARQELVQGYNDLVGQARIALRDLDACVSSLHGICADLILSLPPDDEARTLDSLSEDIHAAFRALSTLLIIAREQHAVISTPANAGAIRHQLASRSYKAREARKARPQSSTSFASRASRRSDKQAKGVDEELLDAGQFDDDERRDRIGHVRSTSSTSLAAKAAGPSAASSTTSLAYQKTDSDSGSQKGSRNSLLRAFRRNRADSDADSRSKGKGQGTSRKLAKLLGDDSFSQPSHAGPSTPVSAPTGPPVVETPWYLGEDYESNEIVFDEKGQVKAGTLRALVARLTPHGQTDTPFFQAFLLTFRSFTNGPELFAMLLERYELAMPDGLTEREQGEWKKLKQTPIRLRVFNTVRLWLENHYLEEDSKLLDRFEDFSNLLLSNGSPTMSKQLGAIVQRRRMGDGDQPRRIVSGGLLSPPAPILPRTSLGRSMRITDIAPVELARQLTIMESQHFQRIKPVECLNKAWARDDGLKAAPNVRWVILTANRMAGWVALQILSSRDVKVRAGVMKFFIQTAIELRLLNNFSSMAGVVAGLNSAPIARLKRTQELLSQKTQAMKTDLETTLDSTRNFQNYKDMLKRINPPCVPFFGFYLSMLTFVEDGNKDILPAPAVNPPATPLINFFKRQMSAEILRDIQQYQSQPYNLARCSPVYNFVQTGLEAVEKAGDLYETSLMLEPREKEEERITRMLHDSVSPSTSTPSASASTPAKPNGAARPKLLKSKSGSGSMPTAYAMMHVM